VILRRELVSVAAKALQKEKHLAQLLVVLRELVSVAAKAQQKAWM
jgi:hypothetical protein